MGVRMYNNLSDFMNAIGKQFEMDVEPRLITDRMLQGMRAQDALESAKVAIANASNVTQVLIAADQDDVNTINKMDIIVNAYRTQAGVWMELYDRM